MDALTQHLQTMLGADAEFRPGQREAIEAVIDDGHRALVVQRTGWGKSLVYWIATRVRRDAGHGPTLIISPLLSLMRNQIAMATRLGLRPATIHSGNVDEWDAVHQGLAADAVDVLLISPERLANERFTRDVLPSIRGSIGLFVIDEAHCISDWGHDFRPDYRRIGGILRSLERRVPVLGTTATANDRVVADVVEQLGEGVRVIRGPLGRRSLRLDVFAMASQADRLGWLAEYVPQLSGSGIVYCLTVADTQRVAAFLRDQGIAAQAYNGELATEEREALENSLLAGEVKALVATVALGMGFDMPDLGFVVHYQRPSSAIAYYQQVGRAGRALELADGILLSGREDDEIAAYFMDSAFPPTVHMESILEALAATDSMSKTQLQRTVNLRVGQIDQVLKLLEIDGAVAHEGSRFRRTDVQWQQDDERIARVKASRLDELAQMQGYVAETGCLMAYLTGLLDDPATEPCGRCANDVGPAWPHEAPAERVQAAITFLKRDLRPIRPRKLWPADAVPGLSGKINPPNESGVALCVYGDAGWGREVQRGRVVDGVYARELVVAAARVIRDRWHPDPAPTWVAGVPSMSVGKRGMVSGLARQLARELGLPYVDCLVAAEPGGAPGGAAGAEPQAAMQNSVLQLRNAHAKLSVSAAPTSAGPGPVLPGPVLLVDDIVDSGWTLTVAGSLLRAGGSGPVYPFTLADASGRDPG